ncbi:ATP-binding protein [Streptomyces sp. NPDC005251]|uniref:ATP-binding protein n=1 Tax=unclassified Streptomyces TaxID=2593676 RepID=UPI00339E0B70
MTASRAPRRGPSASPAPEIRALEHETRASEQGMCETDEHALRARPTEQAEPPAPAVQAPSGAPASPAGSTPCAASVGSGPSGAPASPAGSASSAASGLPVVPVPSGAAAPKVIPSSPVRGAHLLRTTVPAHPSRVPGVRAMVAEYLTRLRLPPERADDAVLAAGELFTNALRHGSPDRGDTITVIVECDPCELRLSVADRSSALPAARTAGGAEESGRGLAIIAALTDDWGIAPADPGTTGKKVWFSMVFQGEP